MRITYVKRGGCPATVPARCGLAELAAFLQKCGQPPAGARPAPIPFCQVVVVALGFLRNINKVFATLTPQGTRHGPLLQASNTQLQNQLIILVLRMDLENQPKKNVYSCYQYMPSRAGKAFLTQDITLSASVFSVRDGLVQLWGKGRVTTGLQNSGRPLKSTICYLSLQIDAASSITSSTSTWTKSSSTARPRTHTSTGKSAAQPTPSSASRGNWSSV